MQRGNVRGAVALLSRAGERVGTWAGDVPHELDLDGLSRAAADLVTRIERDGLDALDGADLRLRLRSATPPGAVTDP